MASTIERPERRVLILGAGLVSRPIVRHFLADARCRLTVGSLAPEDGAALVGGHPRGTTRGLDAADPAQVDPLVEGADLVVSLLPYGYHVQVAKCAIRHRVPMVTASYVSPEMRGLDAEARAAGITILNEVGLDPGIDHMSAMRLIDGARAGGDRVLGFTSCCGSLPAPEAATNPWKYKFSWSPRGALAAAKLPARYLERGREIGVAEGALHEHARPCAVEGLGRFEIYPNRDSLQYIEPYGLAGVETMLRATLRYPGWSETFRALGSLDLLDAEEREWPPGATYADLLNAGQPGAPGSRRERLARRLGLADGDPVLERLEWAGLLSDEPLTARRASRLDLLADRLQRVLRFAEGERDMVVLRHEIAVRRDRGDDERRISLLVAYGEPGGDSATARTVSLPAAVAGDLLLDGGLEPGVHIPTCKAIYAPILERLAPMGIAFREWSVAA